jgi:hypothetical protein
LTLVGILYVRETPARLQPKSRRYYCTLSIVFRSQVRGPADCSLSRRSKDAEKDERPVPLTAKYKMEACFSQNFLSSFSLFLFIFYQSLLFFTYSPFSYLLS